ncbi:MAG TPA: hypothetical protein DEA80_18140 [Afipia sp.]|nr:hypothetical protein [Afipia sp.]OUX61747.1 MAG: hypothetical protein CBB64_08195 [Afipia sp. TMED4]HAO40668.1 hypothetical protein [Afipia sp.]HAP46153.1 hypothetical protein [Afipia sp.]HBF54942.1 hypothetical protein [Afipia sp.]
MRLGHDRRSIPCIVLSMINALSIADATWAFLGLIASLLVASTALFWSIEDQRAKRRLRKD